MGIDPTNEVWQVVKSLFKLDDIENVRYASLELEWGELPKLTLDIVKPDAIIEDDVMVQVHRLRRDTMAIPAETE